MRQAYDRLDPQSRRLGKGIGYPAKLDRLSAAEEANGSLAEAIAALAMHRLNATDMRSSGLGSVFRVREAMQHFVRDWSREGASEREKIFTQILDVLRKGKKGRVLVPGSGVGRLAWDISQLGFDTTANELSQYMNLALNFLLNPASTPTTAIHGVQPWAHRFSHQRLTDSAFRAIPFPDALPRLSSTFQTSEGDFLKLSSGGYDYIVTLFFIDTSANLAATLLQIYSLLAPGGTWINLGPLLWASGGTVGLELSLEEVRELIQRIGLRMDMSDGVRQARTIECEYTQDPLAMFQRIYRAEFWVATRPA